MEATCTILGHYWLYNFPSMPNKRICKHCKEKNVLDLHNLTWMKAYNFVNLGTDEEIINRWHSINP